MQTDKYNESRAIDPDHAAGKQRHINKGAYKDKGNLLNMKSTTSHGVDESKSILKSTESTKLSSYDSTKLIPLSYQNDDNNIGIGLAEISPLLKPVDSAPSLNPLNKLQRNIILKFKNGKKPLVRSAGNTPSLPRKKSTKTSKQPTEDEVSEGGGLWAGARVVDSSTHRATVNCITVKLTICPLLPTPPLHTPPLHSPPV